MAYQLVKKPREIPAGSYEKMDVQAPNTQAAGGLTAWNSRDLGMPWMPRCRRGCLGF